MRVVIESTDRIGISQEILTIFTQHAWNLKAVEISSCFTYADIDSKGLTLAVLTSALATLEGFIAVREIPLLPREQRESHLQALLDKIPEPIIDLDKNGHILAINKAAKVLLFENTRRAERGEGEENFDCIGRAVSQYIKPIQLSLMTRSPSSHAVTLNSKAFIADISPVFSRVPSQTANGVKQVTGAVVVLRSMPALGRQISLMQSHQAHGFDSIIGQSNKIVLVKEQSKRFAELDLAVLIHGETGTGKELIARAIHHTSPRANAPFLAINCAALPEHLLESELFGYASGAFTGAQKGGKPGLIELAEGGSVFLDEIAEMSGYLQAKLLRFLQDFSYRRVGGTKELHANVRVISASHQNLVELIARKVFREDLYYRLNVLTLELPPLRERESDIPLLASFFLCNAAKQVTQSSATNLIIPVLTEQALVLLQHYHWPGNVRQLHNVLFNVVALNKGTKISADDLQQVLVKFSNTSQDIQEKNALAHSKDWSSALAEFEASLLQEFYPLYPSTRKLAQRLKVSHNKIAMKLRQYGLN